MINLVLPTSAMLFVLLVLACVLAFRRRTLALGKLRWIFVLLLLWTWCFSTPAVGSALLDTLEHQYADDPHPPATDDALIVVLSSGLYGQTRDGWMVMLDRGGWERTYAGIRLWRQIGGQLLFVGEPTPDGRSSVAELMAEVAATSGVPASAVRIETRSQNTYQNLAFSTELLAAHGDRLWLVTSALHMPRAMAVAHKLGLQPHAHPCDRRALDKLHWFTWLPAAGGPELFHDALHEWIGRAWYRWKGWT